MFSLVESVRAFAGSGVRLFYPEPSNPPKAETAEQCFMDFHLTDAQRLICETVREFDGLL